MCKETPCFTCSSVELSSSSAILSDLYRQVINTLKTLGDLDKIRSASFLLSILTFLTTNV